MRLYDAQLMRLLSFLTRKQAWLLPKDVAASFRIDGETITSRTVQRWFAFLREHGVDRVFPPGSSLEAIVNYLREAVPRVRGAA